MHRNKERSPQVSENQETDEKEQDHRLGAKILSLAHFETSHKPIVESSFNRALKNNEKLPGKNDERRNLSYLDRLNKLIEKHGNKAEQKLWQASIKDDLLVKYDDIPESYWNAKRQELRDNGYGDYELTEEYKREIYEKERELQKESLEKWANYLGDEHSPYPLWFKVYAWDGMTKMGKYNKGKGKYETRNETTVAPYPNPDAEVLAGVFDVINRYYGNNEKEFYTEEGERNIKLEQIVQSGSFPKIFNAIQQDIAPIIEPPEKAEDVHGEWVEYQLGDEDDVARAAVGTGWCVASSAIGRHYLEYGTYSYEDGINNQQNQAKFILFHLVDEKTGKLSRNAVASIRLDLKGRVDEISGIKKGQALSDSLVQIVEEKVKSLPGGEEFLPKFADKNELIRLDRKMQKGEALTREELAFIYEINRPIRTLDSYNDHDPRISELKQRYGIKSLLNAGFSVDELVSKLDPDTLADKLDDLIRHDADINQLVPRLKPRYIVCHLGKLVSRYDAKIDVNQLVSKLGPRDIELNLDDLIRHGLDVNQLIPTKSIVIIHELDYFIRHGFDVNQLVSKLDPNDLCRYLGTLISYSDKIDLDLNQLVPKLGPRDIANHLNTLISHGVNIDINQLVSELDPDDVDDNLGAFIRHHADVNQLVSKLDPNGIFYHLNTLISHGANINVNQLVSKLDPDTLANSFRSYRINPRAVSSTRMRIYLIDDLIRYGADVNQLVSKIGPDTVASYNLDRLRRRTQRKIKRAIETQRRSGGPQS